MSRFFRAGSDSESESDSSVEEVVLQRPGVSRNVFQMSDDDEDTKRIVRSEKDKRFEEMHNVINHLTNHKKIKDMANVLSDFESLIRAFEKARKVVDKEGIPRFYIRCMVDLEDFVKDRWDDKDWRKSINKNNAKGLTTLRQKLKKYLRDFEDEVTKYRENPDAWEDNEKPPAPEPTKEKEVPVVSDEEDNEKVVRIPVVKPVKKGGFSDDEDYDSDDSLFGGMSTSDSETDSEDEKGPIHLTAEWFLKTTTEDDRLKKEEIKKERKREREEKKKKQREDEEREAEEGWHEVKPGAPSMREKPKMFNKDQEITHDAVIKKMFEILSVRGKRSTDRSEQIDLFRELLTLADTAGLGPGIAVKIMFNIMSAIFDYNPNIATCMWTGVWRSCLTNLQILLTLLNNNKDIVVGPNVPEDGQSFEKAPYRIRGCILTLVEKMDEEFTKMLQSCDAHSTQYVNRLKDEERVASLTRQLEKYLDGRAQTDEMCRLYLRRIEQTYYKLDQNFIIKEKDDESTKEETKSGEDASEGTEKTEETTAEKTQEKSEEKIEEKSAEKSEEKSEEKSDETKDETKEETNEEKSDAAKDEGDSVDKVDDSVDPEESKEEVKEKVSIFPVFEVDPEKSEDMMDRMCKYIYAKDSTDRLRTRSMLCHIYHHALHDRWYQARDLILMSHLQDTIQHSDIHTQILYNRTLVQLGLCAFRRGMIRDAHNALVDIQSSNRAKELLAQGLLPQRQHERTPEQEKVEKRRLLPYHKHINLELLECVYLVSAMLLEIPYMAAHELDVRRRMISKNFHHVLKMSERQNLTGPPESMREHVVAASKAMKNGDWVACKKFVINDKMNAKVWNLFHEKDIVRDMITNKIQEESLRTYLFTYSSVYDSLSIDVLAEMFELTKPVVHSIISKMIINEELMGSLDEPTQTVVMHRTEPSRLQSLALQLSEKVSTLVENNERIMEMKQGNFYFQKSNNPGGYQPNQNWNRRDNWDNQNQGGWNRRNRNDRQDNRQDNRRDNRQDNRRDNRYDNNRRDNRYDNRRDNRYDNRRDY